MKREEERQLKRKAFQEDMERRRKADEARRETEAILAAQVCAGGQGVRRCVQGPTEVLNDASAPSAMIWPPYNSC